MSIRKRFIVVNNWSQGSSRGREIALAGGDPLNSRMHREGKTNLALDRSHKSRSMEQEEEYLKIEI